MQFIDIYRDREASDASSLQVSVPRGTTLRVVGILPHGSEMQPRTMAELWGAAISDCEKRGEKVTDAFGRTLLLHRLPEDLLAMIDPRQVVADGTRLPEDVENWSAWVRKEQP